jgi:predicted glycosyltransferase involved in capsule biosynthesis
MTKSHQKFLKKLNKNDYDVKKHPSPTNISFSFIYNNREQYRQHLENMSNHYSSLNLPFKTEIVVYDENEESFDMSRARNKSLEKCNFDHVFMLDLDCYLSAEEILRIIKIWDEKNHCGVFNLKPSYTSGNGLWFGEKEVFMKNKYSEKFKKFWCEDTEFFLNFSRIGILPMVVFCNSEVVEHSRNYTNNFVNLNHGIFRDILQGIQER